MSDYAKKLSAIIVFLALLPAFVFLRPAESAVVEAGRDLQQVMGELCALSAAMRLYYDDTHSTRAPDSAQLAHYFKNFGDVGTYRIAENNGTWWVGREVPEFSRARPFLRKHAEEYGLYDSQSGGFWLGGAFVWRKAVVVDRSGKRPRVDESSALRAASGEGEDNQRLFFAVSGTDRFWWSNLFFTTGAHAALLKNFGSANEGPFVVPPAPPEAKEELRASPVSVPPEFTVRMTDSDDFSGIEMGEVIFTPIPRHRGDGR